MIYRVPKTSEIDEILVMKNNVKKRVIESGLPMWLNGYPLDEMIVEDVQLGDARVIELDGKIDSEVSELNTKHETLKDDFNRHKDAYNVYTSETTSSLEKEISRSNLRDNELDKKISDEIVRSIAREGELADKIFHLRQK